MKMSLFDGQSGCDRVAIGLSALCAAHCLITPLVILLVPALGLAAGASVEMLHFALLLVIIPVSGIALVHGYRQHGCQKVIKRAGAGLVLLVLAVSAGHSLAGAYGETLLTLAGSGLLIAGHWRNARLRVAAQSC